MVRACDSLQYVLENLRDLVIKSAYPTQGEDPVFAQDLPREHERSWRNAFGSHPEKYVAQERAISCTHSVAVADDLEPRHFVIRSYLVAEGDSYTVMRGALTRITPSAILWWFRCRGAAGARIPGSSRERP